MTQGNLISKTGMPIILSARSLLTDCSDSRRGVESMENLTNEKTGSASTDQSEALKLYKAGTQVLTH